MSRLGAKEIATDRELGLRSELEETVDAHTSWKDAGWVMHGDNQQTLLNEFFRTVRPHASLVFFYAKHTPLSDDPRRALIGAAEITRLTPAGRYRTDGHEQFPAQLWETTIEHSLRPQMLVGADGRVVRPDFTITTDLGELVLWEHLGMLGDPAYAAKWRKREWYERSGLALVTDAGGSTGTLVVTDDTEGVDCPAWELLARKALGL
jgi:hypothetical protein